VKVASTVLRGVGGRKAIHLLDIMPRVKPSIPTAAEAQVVFSPDTVWDDSAESARCRFGQLQNQWYRYH